VGLCMNLEDVRQIGVVGAGTMGAGIAQVAALSGYKVVLYDISDEIVARAKERVGQFIHRLAEKGRMTGEEAGVALERITPSSSLEAMGGVQVVIEAAPERLDVKQQLFRQLEPLVAPETILATNTSTLSVTQLAAVTERPERVAGMHFFNPAPLMPLVEVIAAPATAEPVVETLVGLAEAMGKKPARCQDVPGFIVNRIARPFHLEGLRLLEQGVADIATLDRLVRAGGFKMGPFELQDLIGIDINFAASHSIYNAFDQAPRFRPSHLQRRQVESGKLGRKTGAGWYDS
jgi:3-hydroxybutyryl-CoA dehydrogenase